METKQHMSSNARNQEIVKKFLDSKAFDFAAFGNFVAENGASLASSSDSEFGFIIGFRFVRYCIPPVSQVTQGVDPAELALRGEVTGL
jgi:hypothetical protein